ncbi:MAG: MFS transporter [Proteobacteria bacterium]|nr:MFS transporter [Pseudomonadota bacterium]
MTQRDPAAVPVAAIAAMSFAAFASAASLRVTDPSLTRIAHDFDVSLNAASYAITAFSLAYGLFQIAFGPAGDRFGKLRVVNGVCWLSVGTALLCAWSPNYPALLVARAASGLAAAAILPLSMAWIGDVVPYHQRQPVLARFLTGQILGVASGGLIGGYAADHFGWRSAFLLIAAWFGVAAAMLVRVRRGLPPPVLVALPPGQSALGHTLASMRDVTAERWPRVVLATVCLEGAALFGAFAFAATHVHLRFGLSLTLSGGVALLFGLGGLAFAVASRTMVGRLGEVRMPVAGALLIGAGFTVLGVVPSVVAASAGLAVAGFGFYMLHNSLQTQATQMAPARRGASMSLFSFCYYVGQSVGVALAGVLLHVVSTSVLMVGGAVAVTAVGLNYARLRARRDSAPVA